MSPSHFRIDGSARRWSDRAATDTLPRHLQHFLPNAGQSVRKNAIRSDVSSVVKPMLNLAL